jgi:dihydroorotase-like cyclic amidohydrolase
VEDIVLKNRRLLEREGLNDIGIKLGRISKVGRELKGQEEYDVSGKIVLPGMGICTFA